MDIEPLNREPLQPLMLCLSIDQSTSVGSAAILDDQRVVVARQWSDTSIRRQQLLLTLKVLFQEADLEPPAIRLYVVGVGPGSYSGLRVAVTAARAMALPGRIPVYGITSAEALAWQTAEAEGVERVCIVGDARRDQWWARCFRHRGDFMSPVGEWALTSPSAFQSGEAQAIATPDWERLGKLLQAAVSPAVTLVARSCIPDAAALGRLAMARRAHGMASEPLAPVYLHPAVHVKTSDCQAAGHSV